jgi:polysaccharide deacetylase family protein (PEP-CTERM system associated)
MHILTFDIEEWFHILDHADTRSEAEWNKFESRIHANCDRILDLLDRKKVKATFFCLGWVAEKYPEVIRKIDAAGYEIGTHSHMHQLAYEQDKKVFAADLSRSIQTLEDVIGKKVRSYRAPGFSLMQSNKWVFEALVAHGIEIDCSVFPAKRAHGGFEDFPTAQPSWVDLGGARLKEFPINLASVFGKSLVFSGGGYFRLLPLPVLKHFWSRSEYIMTYFHPRDFDAHQPMVPGLSKIRQFKSYYGLSAAMDKLEAIIDAFPMIDLLQAEREVDWEQAPVYHLNK